jgi:hypothetical protein
VCEVCRDPQLDAEKQERISVEGGLGDSFLCEHPVKGTPGLCGLPATWAVKFNYVEEHLCDTHRTTEADERETGLTEFLQATGLETGCAVLAIQDRARCEYSPPLGSSRACGKIARWAVIVAAESYYCDDHMTRRTKELEGIHHRQHPSNATAAHPANRKPGA